MFWFKKSSEALGVVLPLEKPEEIMGMKEYVSVDSIKAHLVDILEENKELKEKIEKGNRYERSLSEEYRKKYELSQITADEYKKRLTAEQERARNLEREMENQKRENEALQKKYNDLVCENEMRVATVAEKATEPVETDIQEITKRARVKKAENIS
jgi:predicted RNase H-like nuclease (RuvC/YqgF family)